MNGRPFGHIYRPKNRTGVFVKFSLGGTRVHRRAGRTVADAEAALRKIEHLALEGHTLEVIDAKVFGNAPASRMTFTEAAPEYLAASEKLKKASTIESDIYRLRGICKARWAKKPLRAVTTIDVQRWLERRRQQVSVATVNRDHSTASALYKWAIAMGYATDNPFRSVPKASEKGRERTMFLTVEECRALLEATTGSLHAFLHLGLHTGFRKGELCSLTWDSVDFDLARIHVEPDKAKSGRGRYVPMSPHAAALLRELLARRPKGARTNHVILTNRGRPLNNEALRRRWKALRRRSIRGISPTRLKAVSAHVLRHTYASHLASAGVALTTIAQLLGHSSAYVTERYAHLCPSPDDTVGAIISSRLSPGGDLVREGTQDVLDVLDRMASFRKPFRGPSADAGEAA